MTALVALVLAGLAQDPLLPGKPFVLRGHTETITALAFSADGTLLASVSRDKTVRVWDLRSGEQKRSLPGAKAMLTSVAFSPDGTLLAVGDAGLEVRVFEVASGALKRSIVHHEGVLDVALSPDGTLLAVGGQGGNGGVYSLADGKEKYEVAARAVRFSRDGKVLVVGGRTPTLALVDVKTGKPGKTVDVPHVPFVTASSDLKVIVTWSGRDVDLRAFDGALRALPDFRGPPTDARREQLPPVITSAALSGDGTVLVSAAGDRLVRVWDVAKRAVTKTLPLERDGFLALSPDKAWVAVADGAVVKLFKLTE